MIRGGGGGHASRGIAADVSVVVYISLTLKSITEEGGSWLLTIRNLRMSILLLLLQTLTVTSTGRSTDTKRVLAVRQADTPTLHETVKSVAA